MHCSAGLRCGNYPLVWQPLAGLLSSRLLLVQILLRWLTAVYNSFYRLLSNYNHSVRPLLACPLAARGGDVLVKECWNPRMVVEERHLALPSANAFA
jgi:hypothetical protein